MISYTLTPSGIQFLHAFAFIRPPIPAIFPETPTHHYLISFHLLSSVKIALPRKDQKYKKRLVILSAASTTIAAGVLEGFICVFTGAKATL